MSTKSLKHKINPKYADLFSFKDENEELEHQTQMISFRMLSEVERLCCKRNLSKAKLATDLNISKSYITQLFNGSKNVNTTFLAKIEALFDATFEIKLRLNNETYSSFIAKEWLENNNNNLFNLRDHDGCWFYKRDKKKEYTIDEEAFVGPQKEERKYKQIA